MDATKRERIEAAGFRVGTVSEFLELTPEERELVELRLALSTALKGHRLKERLSQERLARRLNSSQSRVAKMEAGDSSVSIDLLIRALLAAGATRKELAHVIADGAGE
ncbi:MAG TPA: helix-turn-helix transcriptional regulator [Chthonomonadaceae bacterium]|nr:helix-turn-helix transcriptional regulator [Chthonomonadaceae bacterium]